MDLDLQYVGRKSLWLDLKILASTPYAVLRQCREAMLARRAARTALRETSLAALGSAGLPANNSRDAIPASTLAIARRAALRTGPRRLDGLSIARTVGLNGQ